MDHVFRNLMEGVRESQDADAMRTVMAEAVGAFDLQRFSYFSPSGGHRGASIFISTYPTSWTDHYFARGYDAIDPIFTIARAKKRPFQWGKDAMPIELAASQKQLFDEAATFGIRNGLTFPLACQGEAFAALTIAADEKPTVFKRRLEICLPTLRCIAIAFHSQLRQKPSITQLVNGIPLTRREIECLHWTARGKTKWEIGRIIGVRPYTVTFHLKNARLKLGVHTLFEAVARFAHGG